MLLLLRRHFDLIRTNAPYSLNQTENISLQLFEMVMTVCFLLRIL